MDLVYQFISAKEDIISVPWYRITTDIWAPTQVGKINCVRQGIFDYFEWQFYTSLNETSIKGKAMPVKVYCEYTVSFWALNSEIQDNRRFLRQVRPGATPHVWFS